MSDIQHRIAARDPQALAVAIPDDLVSDLIDALAERLRRD